MALSKLNGENQAQDFQQQRPSFGTLTGEHILNGSVDNTSIAGLVDDQDPSIIYGFNPDFGGVPYTLTASSNTPWDVKGSSTLLPVLGAAVQYFFKGTSIGIVGRFNKFSANLRVYIDGVETPGRALTYCGLQGDAAATPNYYSINNPLTDTATTIYTDVNSPQNLFGPGPGVVQIGDEQIAFTTASTLGGRGVLSGCVRGVNGTVAASHTWEQSIYLYTSRPSAFGDLIGNYGTGQLIWLKNNLPDGDHRITVLVMDDSSTGNTKFWFDGFMNGPIIGSSQIYRTIATVTKTVTTDANGFANLYPTGTVMGVRTGQSVIGLMGYNQIAPDPKLGATLAKLICYPDATTQIPTYAIVNGSASTAYTIQLVLSYLSDVV